MKSRQSNFNLRSPGSYLARSYLIATVSISGYFLGHNIFDLLLKTIWVNKCLNSLSFIAIQYQYSEIISAKIQVHTKIRMLLLEIISPKFCALILTSWTISRDSVVMCRFRSAVHTELFTTVIYTKYSKHWPYTVAHIINCVCIEMLNHGLNHGFFLLFFKLKPCPIHWIVCVLA